MFIHYIIYRINNLYIININETRALKKDQTKK